MARGDLEKKIRELERRGPVAAGLGAAQRVEPISGAPQSGERGRQVERPVGAPPDTFDTLQRKLMPKARMTKKQFRIAARTVALRSSITEKEAEVMLSRAQEATSQRMRQTEAMKLLKGPTPGGRQAGAAPVRAPIKNPFQ